MSAVVQRFAFFPLLKQESHGGEAKRSSNLIDQGAGRKMVDQGT